MSSVMEDDMIPSYIVSVQFKNEFGEIAGQAFEVQLDVSVTDLRKICNTFLEKDETIPILFFVNGAHIKTSLGDTLGDSVKLLEGTQDIVYVEQAPFRVRPITRCTGSIPGHAEAVVSASFSPDGRYLASGSGDTTVRLWDVNTETPQYTCKGHKHWVLCIAWSPDGKKLASGCKNSQVCIWSPETGKQIGRTLTGHKFWINALVWEPLHRNGNCQRLASASKDGTVRIWDAFTQLTLLTISAHTHSVTCIKWGGNGLLYTGSQDRTVKVWRADDGVLCRTLQGHGHWVNTLALNVDYVLRTGAFDPSKASLVHKDTTLSAEELAAAALMRYNLVKGPQPEYLVSGSDDFTLIMWMPETDKKLVTRMTGHQQLINDVKFSPDMKLIASASFDKSVKLWQGKTGKFITSLRAHVQAVYQICWSADSRLLVSSSADSTLKLWDLENRRLMSDLPGHADEVYAVDWSPDGQRVVSGGKDKVIKMWRH